jgi:hypothetical protein
VAKTFQRSRYKRSSRMRSFSMCRLGLVAILVGSGYEELKFVRIESGDKKES